MLDTLQNQLQLPAGTLVLVAAVVLIAGIVRGFSGFGLSALIMASLALLIPPISLIPICFVLEMAASVLMVRGGLSDANRKVVMGLVIGSAFGVPIGLAATHALSPEVSRLVALVLILVLALLQFFAVSPALLRARWGVYAAGLCSGIATGLASIGGMIVALYVLALNAPPREVRGSLVLFLVISMLITGIWLLVTGTLDSLALKRGLFFSPAAVAGVLIGMWLFRPSLEPFYKRFCLFLLIGLAGFGLLRMAVL